MPAAVMEEELLSCPICFELYKLPRTLPCLHSFCEPCLSSYIASSFISQGKEPIGFNCPVCRTLTNPPKTSEDPSTWVNYYHINEGLQSQCEEKKRLAAERKSCDICEGGKNDAEFWCRECKACS
ncbi:hypothetical protein KUTeg_008666 [Tegillarca granosa]|uniref:RING-type domain-containing protein n=1 Tax=Tegillarca granosa TaxID=220873 RepID=A0ABQ9F9U3_TEGGR|nr:hypothetical protein KUTeg_008666 [Tegillarca granosa]